MEYKQGLTLGEFIAKSRTEIGMTQVQLAAAVGMKSHQEISALERRIYTIPLKWAPLMADALLLNRQDFCKRALHEAYPLMFESLFPSSKPA